MFPSSQADSLSKRITNKTKYNRFYIEGLIYSIHDKALASLHAVRPKELPLVSGAYALGGQDRAFCALTFMFPFVYYELVVRKNKLSTVLSKLTNLFSKSLFDYEPAINVEDWDEEDSNLFIHEILINPDLAENTNHSKLSQFSILNFVKF
jgi:hypothetical protein